MCSVMIQQLLLPAISQAIPTKHVFYNRIISLNYLINTTWCQIIHNRNNLLFKNFSPNSNSVGTEAT